MRNYKRMLEKTINNIESNYRAYERNLKTHPEYANEWAMFFEDRCTILMQENIDPRTYNFTPEWIDFWFPRMQQLKFAEFAKKEEEINRFLTRTNGHAKIYKKKKSFTRKRIHLPVRSSDDEFEVGRRPRRAKLQRIQASSEEDEDNDPINMRLVCSLLNSRPLITEFDTVLRLKVIYYFKICDRLENFELKLSNVLLMDDETIEFLDRVKEALTVFIYRNRNSNVTIFALRKVLKLKYQAFVQRFLRA